MKTIQGRGRTYMLKAVPPWVQPLLHYYGTLMKKEPDGVDEAIRLADQQKAVLTKLFAETIAEPNVDDEDTTAVLMEIIQEINQLGEESKKMIELFRERQHGSEGGGVRDDTA